MLVFDPRLIALLLLSLPDDALEASPAGDASRVPDDSAGDAYADARDGPSQG
jgi:hypothetical protein